MNTYSSIFVLDDCQKCKLLLGYDEGDKNLHSIFKYDCKIKAILMKQGFNLFTPKFGKGKVSFERLRRGSQVRHDLAARQNKPDLTIDYEILKLARLIDEYGLDAVKFGIFIDRFEAVCISHPANIPLMYRYKIRLVPTVISPFAPRGIARGVSVEEPEAEFEKLLFLGGSRIRPQE